MDRREMLTVTGMGLAGFTVGTGFTAPACGVSKDKAVRVAGFVIELSKEAVPLLNLLGAQNIAELVATKVTPVMEKLKELLSKVDIPQAETTLELVRGTLKSVGDALLSLPDSSRRNTIIGILASINVLLLTVEAFVESESTVKSAGLSAVGVRDNKLLKVYAATRQ